MDLPEVTTETLDRADGTPVLTIDEIEKLATEAIDAAPDLTFTPGGPGTFAPGSLPAAEGDDYTPTSAELAAQLEGSGLPLDDLRTDVSDVAQSVQRLRADFDVS